MTLSLQDLETALDTRGQASKFGERSGCLPSYIQEELVGSFLQRPQDSPQPHSFLKPLLSQLQHLELQFVPNGTGKTVFKWHNGPKSQLRAGDRGHSGMGVLTRVCPQRATIPVSVISAVGDSPSASFIGNSLPQRVVEGGSKHARMAKLHSQ